MLDKPDHERLLDNEKPMVSYYKAVGEDYYYDGREIFCKLANESTIKRRRFFISNEGQNFRIAYEIYAKPENDWRLEIYHLLKKIGQDIWNADLEEIEGILLGYRGMYENAAYENPVLINATTKITEK